MYITCFITCTIYLILSYSIVLMAKLSLSTIIFFILLISTGLIALKFIDSGNSDSNEKSFSSTNSFYFKSFLPSSFTSLEEKAPFLAKVKNFFTDNFDKSDKNFFYFTLGFMITFSILFLLFR